MTLDHDRRRQRRGETAIDDVTRVSVLRTTEATDDPTFHRPTAQGSRDPAADICGESAKGGNRCPSA
jgi:hypothetical protein